MADLLSWPSNFGSWERFLDWLINLAPSLPIRLIPSTVQVFEVWQNALADLKNARSAAIIDICADWLMQLEGVEFPAKLQQEPRGRDTLGREAKSHLATALRSIILRSARAYPAPARALFERAIANKHMRLNAYKDLMAFTPIMAEISPELVATVAKAELIEELPQDRLDRERRKRREQAENLARLRAIPEKDRTEDQRRALEHTFFPIGYDRIDLDDIGIDRHHNYYFPPSALHEPFAMLFARKPEAALELVRELANHATKGWRQVHLINRQSMGTPIPLALEFPWGKQEFWGDWHVYCWFMGELAPQPLECAFLALSYWAFKQVEERWSRLSEQIFRVDKWSICRG